MPRKKLLCLALSRKMRGTCIAGIDAETHTWLRPVNTGGAELCENDIRYQSGDDLPKLLDVMEIVVTQPEPLYYQPENWVIDGSCPWRKAYNLLERKGTNKQKVLDEFLSDQEYVLGNTSDRLTPEECRNLKSSIMLIKVPKATFEVTLSIRHSLQVRAHFPYRSNEYNLVVTDIAWENKMKTNALGLYEYNTPFYLTIGLGQKLPALNAHFKLVAGVIPVRIL